MFQIVINYIDGRIEGKSASEFYFQKKDQAFYLNIDHNKEKYAYGYSLIADSIEKIEVFSESNLIFSIGYNKSIGSYIKCT